MDIVNRITLEYLTNYKHTLVTDKSTICKKDMKFYRKRIIGMVKDLLYDENAIFSKQETDFINNCIENFKTIDNTDLLQKELDNIDHTTTAKLSVEYKNQDKLLMRTKKVNMDSFVKRSGGHQPIMPQRREVKLDDPSLRIKGLQIKEKVEEMVKEKEKEISQDIYETKNKEKNKKKEKTKLYVEIDK